MRPLSWIVTASSLAILLLGARVLAGRRGHRAPPEPTEETPAPAPARALPVFHPAPPASPAPPRAASMCHLRGKVVVPPGAETPDFDELSVTADDGEHEYEAKTNNRGEFELHLPARAYTVTASVDDLVGSAVVRARPGADETTVVLQAAVAITGTVKVPGGASVAVTVSATRAGTTISAGENDEIEGSEFEVRGLMKGATYDVKVAGRGVRTTILRGIAAPGAVEVELAAPATLHGAIGFPAGTDCPIETVTLASEDGEREGEIDRNCRFTFDELEAGSDVELRASGGGWHLETRLHIPERGDPEPLCLNPPCRELPPDVPVELRVLLTGIPGHTGFNVNVTEGDDEHGCGTNGTDCLMEGLAAGESRVTVTAHGCAKMERTVTLTPGTNVAAFACQPLRVVEGIARRADPHTAAVISCPDGDNAVLIGKSVFQLRCPREGTEVRYRAANRPWRTAPLPPNVDPAFVELTL